MPCWCRTWGPPVDSRRVPRLAHARLDPNVAHQRRRHPRGRVAGPAAGGAGPGAVAAEEIRQIRSQTRLGLEVFVHGALCIAVSGQCMASLALGGRSANRGQCAQACRLPYELICDGRPMDLGQRKYLLSPQDLAAYDLLPELLAAGVDAFKIEGRLKSAEYVAMVTRHYRTAIDAACAGHRARFTPQQIAELEVSFSRGFSTGWLEGCDHKALVPGQSSAKQGVSLGVLRGVCKGRARGRVDRGSPAR